MEKLVSILIINWNGEKHLPELLESIKNQTYKNIETIVWDNVSTDKSEEIAKKFEKVKFIASKENLGYSGGTSKAMEIAKGEYFFILNNDLVLDKKMVEECVKTMEESESDAKQVLSSKSEDRTLGTPNENGAGIVFPKELYYPRYPENYSIEFLPKTTFQGNTVKKRINSKETNFVLGAAFLVSKKAMNDLKYCFDERFFMYFEDTDLSFRAIAKGYKIFYEEKAVFWHKTAASIPPTRRYYLFRNGLLCYYKNFGLAGFLKFLPIIFLKDFITVCFDLKFSGKSGQQMLKGYFDAFKMLKNFRGEKFSKEEAKRAIKSMELNLGDGSAKGIKLFLRKFYAYLVYAYMRIMFFSCF